MPVGNILDVNIKSNNTVDTNHTEIIQYCYIHILVYQPTFRL